MGTPNEKGENTNDAGHITDANVGVRLAGFDTTLFYSMAKKTTVKN